MKILAFDSSTSIASVAFLDDEKILFQYHQPQQRTNSSIFFEGLQKAVQQCGKPDRLVVGLGPGSYNGLRSSIAAAQGMATAFNAELVGLPSILGLETIHDSWIIGDARGGQYWLAALSSKQELIEEPFLLAQEDLPNHLKKHPNFSLISSQQLLDLPSSLNVAIKTPDATILARQATSSTSLERFKKSYSRCSTRNEERRPAVYSDTRGPEHRSDAVMRGYNSFENALEPLYLKQPHITMPRP